MKAISQFLTLSILGVLLAACGGDGGGGQQASILSANTRLATLTISAGEFDQIFQSSLSDYTATVSLLRSTTTVTATIEDPNATLTVDGVAWASAAESGKVSLDVGDTMISVIVTAEDGVTTSTYTIRVTRQSAASFSQLAYVKASNTGGGNRGVGDLADWFGGSLVLDRDTLVVGAPNEDSAATGINGDDSDNSQVGSGAAYVFSMDSGGVWSQQSYIKASNAQGNQFDVPGGESDMGDRFGTSIDLYGDTLVVGARSEDSGAVGVNGNQGDDYYNGLDTGAAYVFTRDSGGAWSQQAYIKASNPDGGNWNDDTSGSYIGDPELFGSSIAVDGHLLAIGAPREDSSATGINGDQTDDSATDAGAVYVFVRDEHGDWSQEAYIKSSNTTGRDCPYSVACALDYFGYSLALSGDTLAVGAYGEDSAATGVNGDDPDNSELMAGAVYIFVRQGSGQWEQQAYLKAADTKPKPYTSGRSGCCDFFGFAINLDRDTLAVGMPREDSGSTGVDGDAADNSVDNAGAVYVFSRDGSGTWITQAYLKSSNTGEHDRFGSSVALYGDALIVGAPGESSSASGINGDQLDDSTPGAGAVYAFTRNAEGEWSQQAYIKASNTDGDGFGHSVALLGDTLAVGAYGESSAATGVDGDQSDNSAEDAGAVYVFQ